MRTTYGCSIKVAQGIVDSYANLYEKTVESCQSYASDPARLEGCLEIARKHEEQRQAGLDESYNKWTEWAALNLDRVTKGFPLTDVECIGSGAGFRFRLFRCKVSVQDPFNKNSIAFYRPVTVSGRLLVTVTGKTTFRWSVI